MKRPAHRQKICQRGCDHAFLIFENFQSTFAITVAYRYATHVETKWAHDLLRTHDFQRANQPEGTCKHKRFLI